jgi:phosphatidylserine/phosphatidylglycerophosphate/cardiolipin synthase-like enzyme
MMNFKGLWLPLILVLELTHVAPALAAHTGFSNNADYAPITDLINGARKSVEMELYEMDDPSVVDALRSALQRGIKIQIVQEPKPLGNPCHIFEPSQVANPPGRPQHASGAVPCADQQQLVQDINASGGTYVPYQKATLCTGSKACFQHGKIAVIDGVEALVTTGNFNVSNLCDRAASPLTCDRDFSFVTTDKVAINGLESVMQADMAGNAYDLKTVVTPSIAAKITVGALTLDSLVQFIGSAKKSVQVENQYLKEPTLNLALTQAAQRGVEVSVMVASACSFGKPKPTEVAALTAIFSDFDSAGINTRMFTRNIMVGGFKGYLHAKAIVVDGARAWLGSSNGSKESLFNNREFGIFFDSAADVAGLAGILSSDFSESAGESWQDSLVCAENTH